MSERNGDYCQKCGAPVAPTDEKCSNGHILDEVGRSFVRSAPANISITADAILVRSPLTFLKQAIRDKRFLEGVVVSQTFFERFATERLNDHFKKENISVEILKINEWSSIDRMRMLEAFDIISQPIHSKMGEVRKYRNDIVHKLRNPDLIDENESRRMIEKAIECLKALGAN